MQTTATDETARMELAGAEHRLEHALRSMREFQRLHGVLDDDGFAFRPGIDPHLLASLQRELLGLEMEVDEAWRALRHAKALLTEARPK